MVKRNKAKDFYSDGDIDGFVDKKDKYRKLCVAALKDNLLYLLYKYPLEKVKKIFNKKKKLW